MRDTTEIGREAVDLANKIHDVLRGSSKASAYIAIAMVIGYAEAQAERPDLDHLFKILKIGSQEEFDREMHCRKHHRSN